jgi:hypothetical protein
MFDDFDTSFDFSHIDADLAPDASRTVETSEPLSKPKRYRRENVARREYINGLKREALTTLVTELPPPDVDLYILSNGSGSTYKHGREALAFEFGHFIPVLAEMLGGKGVTAYISTWTMARAHALNLLALVDSGTLAQLAVMTDPYFQRRESAVANTLISGLLARGMRYVAFKNHVKAAILASADQTRFVSVVGSANLSSQPRAENFTLSTDPGLYRFLRDEFFEEMLSHATA